MSKVVSTEIVRKEAESLGFVYRASGDEGTRKAWITFTYPGTNTHVIYIDVAGTDNIMKKLGDELVRCGRIQQRQALLSEVNPFNYS